MSFPEANIKAFIREECLREENGRPRVGERALRVLALFIEGGDGPPLWVREFGEGENDEDHIDVDGLVARLRRKVDAEVNAKRATVMFRLNAIHGTEYAVSPSHITAQYPFTVHPARRVVAESTDEASGYQQSFQDANDKGLAALFMRGMKATHEIYFPELQNLISEKNETIEQLRASLREANNEIKELRGRLDEAEDRRVERVIRLRDAALKQRLKERGGRLVMNTLTMVASSYMASKAAPAMQPHPPPPPPMRGGPSSPQMTGGGGGSQPGGGGGGGEPTEGSDASQTAPVEEASQAPQAHQPDIVFESVRAFRAGEAVDLDGLFGALVEDIIPHIGDLAMAVSADQQAMLVQMFTIWQSTGKLDRPLIMRFAEDLGEDGDNKKLHTLMRQLPNDRARSAFATILMATQRTYDEQKQEDRELEKDLADRVEKASAGEIIDDEPIIPDDPVEDIVVKEPKVLTKKQAEDLRKRRADVKVKQGESDKKRPL